MRPEIPIIDALYYPPHFRNLQSPENCQEPLDRALQGMNSAGIAKVLVTQCKEWSCERQWMCIDTCLDDVLRYTRLAPQRFVGMAGYNPFAISESLAEVEHAVRDCGFRGVYVNAESFGLPLSDRHMYPLFAKAAELGVAVMLQLSAPDSTHIWKLRFQDLEPVAADFADLPLVVTQFGWPARIEITPTMSAYSNVYFAIDGSHLREPAWVKEFLQTDLAQERCIWGSNGIPWPAALGELDRLDLPTPILKKLIHDNAARVFKFDELLSVKLSAPQGEPAIAER